MKFRDRVSLAYQAMTQKQFQSRPLGEVLRNYGKQSNFRPQEQVRGITYKAIDKIGSSLSVYEPIVNKQNGDAYVNHPILTLFNDPNPRMNATDFVHMFGMLYEIYGETFWYLIRRENSRKIAQVELLNPLQMEVKTHNGELVGYILHKSNGDQVPLLIDEIYHDKRPNPFNEWRGLSVLEKASMYVDIEIATTQFTLSYMNNNASPSGIVSLPNMEKDAFKQFAAQWREGYEGPENAGKTAFIRGGEADFKAVGATLKDVDQKVTRDMAKEDVLMMLEVPKSLLGASSDKGFGRADIEALNYVFAKEKIDPLMTRLDRIYSTILKDSFSATGAAIVTHESVIPEDKEFKLKTYEKGANVWLTVDEIRAEQGLKPLPNGQGSVIMPKNTVAPTVESSKSLIVKKKIVLKKQPSKANIEKKLNQEQEQFRTELVKNNDIYAKKMKAAISTFAANQEDRVIANLNATMKSYEEITFSVKEETEALAFVLVPIALDLVIAQSEDVANFITGELLVVTTEIKQQVESQILRIAGLYNVDTIQGLEKTLSEGVANNESLAKLKKRIESVYEESKGYKAERIARTESLRLSNKTAEDVYFQNGFSTVKWFVNPGACEFCLSLSGQKKTIGGNFKNIGDVIPLEDGSTMRIEYDDIGTPPLHPNCKCSIVPAD